ncbi:DUF5753 domain-containing protein [Nonomuraea sp. NPDC050790]|uniref:DUF5753 domain-containing protein n=1 Tax=Nonomuraea sp. NPDC050790 TaxID=3364371 RepID=UPI0037BA1A97
MPLYERTELMRAYLSQVLPGLLQTRGYAVALLRGIAAGHQLIDDVEAAADARVARAAVLMKPGHRFAFVVEEAVLRYQLGGPDVMAAQMEHLLTTMSFPSVSLGVVPTGIIRSAHVPHNFTVFDDTQVSVELVTASITVTAPGEIARYVREFGRLADMAVYGARARELIAKALTAYQRR